MNHAKILPIHHLHAGDNYCLFCHLLELCLYQHMHLDVLAHLGV